ncbi:Type I phosphodiesterase/nucleotide pyrophosphatase/phosphate transferase [Kalmanozyma brasiliensis GHG001]|uniref:Uncharacterized protein n=1 Tax=Kalmanozyma brasiliensis (strain GHG001) TaxID=1365824 RepID=V5E601_KALBG|nr:Type I phosphodiesterase/nucleotide pyrophosphatase/phosphate transferase [Kalmanozyma brasiliensis GHG001]EST05646.1 Type I phosphodiesterase/nucleotide pyrophosphatase/phosphate transferase [Kalmanozyma brasiliensis GHG001]
MSAASGEVEKPSRSGRQAASSASPRRQVAVDATTPLLHRSGPTPTSLPHTRRSSFLCRLLLAILVLGVILSIANSFLPLTPHRSPDDDATSLLPNATLTNGTHTFRRTVILISLDGAKPSYLTPSLTPHLSALGASTARSRLTRLQPIFPTLTFPNHWTLLTGLYASSHGIVANDFHDVRSGEQFYYTRPDRSWDGKWWRGEPVWATVQRAGVRSAVLMWPGPPVTANGDRPRWFQKYESGPQWDLTGRLRQVMTWLDVEEVNERPGLICAYVPDIDQAAHRFGPESKEALQAVSRVDDFIGDLEKQLEKRSLGEVVDVVVVSDHGMTTTSNERLIYLDELLGSELHGKLEHRDGWPSAGLRFKGSEAEQQRLVEQAYKRLSSLKSRQKRGWRIYTREDLPERYHLAAAQVQDRLAPLWLIPDLGWSITTHAEMATFADGVYAPRGNHGYDNEEEDMHAIFVASGPSFAPRSQRKAGSGKQNMDAFANVEVHNLISRILGVPQSKRAPTNGTWTFWDRHLRAGL